jgi:hypothetical protein
MNKKTLLQVLNQTKDNCETLNQVKIVYLSGKTIQEYFNLIDFKVTSLCCGMLFLIPVH